MQTCVHQTRNRSLYGGQVHIKPGEKSGWVLKLSWPLKICISLIQVCVLSQTPLSLFSSAKAENVKTNKRMNRTLSVIVALERSLSFPVPWAPVWVITLFSQTEMCFYLGNVMDTLRSSSESNGSSGYMEQEDPGFTSGEAPLRSFRAKEGTCSVTSFLKLSIRSLVEWEVKLISGLVEFPGTFKVTSLLRSFGVLSCVPDPSWVLVPPLVPFEMMSLEGDLLGRKSFTSYPFGEALPNTMLGAVPLPLDFCTVASL